MSHETRRAVGFVCAIFGSLVIMASASLPSPFYPLLQHEIGFSALAMTVIFSVYALAVLTVLLTAGSVSDHVGRRPVLSLGFLLLAISAFAFDQASTTLALIGARAMQGMACGLLLSTLSATVLDLEPARRPGLAAITNSVAPLLGLSAGALIAGLVIDLSATPKHDAFLVLASVSLAMSAVVWSFPETSPRHHGVWQALKPRVGVPAEVRSLFWAGAPALFASWATGGFYLSLGAPVMSRVFGVESAPLQGLVVALLAGMGALGVLVARRYEPAAITHYGSVALTGGTLLSLIAVASGSLGLYLFALALAGTGFGTCFYGFLRAVVPQTLPEHRGELFSTIFTISYLAFGLPAIIAGLVVQHIGLTATMTGYGLITAAAASFVGITNAGRRHEG